MKTKNKILAVVEIAIVLCSMLLVAPAIAADQGQNTQKTVTTASEDDFTLGIYGNANEDDTIDMRDTTYIKLVIFEKKPKTDLADANYDGKVSMLDVGQTKLIILGKEKKLTLIDLADRTVTINKPVERVVVSRGLFLSLIPIEGEDAFKKIVGCSKSFLTQSRQWFWEKYKDKFPEIEDIPDVGSPSQGSFNIEKVVVLDPDVVIMARWEHEYMDVLKNLEPAGIPVIFVDYDAPRPETYKSTLLQGYVLDKEERAQKLVEFYKEQIDKVYSRMEEIEGKTKPKVYIEGGFRKFWTYGSSGHGLIVEEAGGINIAKDKVKTWGEISPEYILSANPDIIVITGSYWANPGTVRVGYYANPKESRELLKAWVDRPGWETLSAIKNQRVYSTHHCIPWMSWSFVELQFLAKCFYPDEFEDLDPEENFKEFHERFLPVDYSGVWMLSLEE